MVIAQTLFKAVRKIVNFGPFRIMADLRKARALSKRIAFTESADEILRSTIRSAFPQMLEFKVDDLLHNAKGTILMKVAGRITEFPDEFPLEGIQGIKIVGFKNPIIDKAGLISATSAEVTFQTAQWAKTESITLF